MVTLAGLKLFTLDLRNADYGKLESISLHCIPPVFRQQVQRYQLAAMAHLSYSQGVKSGSTGIIKAKSKGVFKVTLETP